MLKNKGAFNIVSAMARNSSATHLSHSKAPDSEVDEKKELAEALGLLQQSGLRRTKSREALLSYLIREHGPFTIEEIFRGIKKKSLDVVTVYRGVLSLEKIGLVRRCDFGDNVARYEFQSDPRHHHHHVICKTCRKMEGLESCRLPADLESRAKQLGYSDLTHSLEFFGICKECKMSSLHPPETHK